MMFSDKRGWRKGRGGGGRRGGSKPGSGPDGYCVCSNCGHRVRHEMGKPCRDMACPKCGSEMVRE
jgi:hypothetical protein